MTQKTNVSRETMIIYPLLTVKINVYQAENPQSKRKMSAFDQFFNVSRETLA